jgi:hypothetical protein
MKMSRILLALATINSVSSYGHGLTSALTKDERLQVFCTTIAISSGIVAGLLLLFGLVNLYDELTHGRS